MEEQTEQEQMRIYSEKNQSNPTSWEEKCLRDVDFFLHNVIF